MADEPKAQQPCQCECGWWHCWLQSWATQGGNLIMLSSMTVFLLAVTIFLMVKFGPAAPAVMFLVPVAGGFAASIMTRMGIEQKQAHAQSGQASADAK